MWCVYFISNVPFFSLFFFSAARVFSLALFRRLLLHFSTSICTSFYSILLLLVRDVESFDLNGSVFDFKSGRAPFALKLCLILSLPFSFAFTDIVIILSICLCFVVLVEFVLPIWVRFCCWFWHHHCATRGVFLCSSKWNNNMCYQTETVCGCGRQIPLTTCRNCLMREVSGQLQKAGYNSAVCKTKMEKLTRYSIR